MLEGNAEIDPVKYGVLWQKVQDINKKMDKMEIQMEKLLDMASQSKGALWVGIAVWSAVIGLLGFFFGKH